MWRCFDLWLDLAGRVHLLANANFSCETEWYVTRHLKTQVGFISGVDNENIHFKFIIINVWDFLQICFEYVDTSKTYKYRHLVFKRGRPTGGWNALDTAPKVIVTYIMSKSISVWKKGHLYRKVLVDMQSWDADMHDTMICIRCLYFDFIELGQDWETVFDANFKIT